MIRPQRTASLLATGPGKNHGFTLIELLVVIAIIAILASILFPVFAQARAKARAATCLSNEKQIGLGLMMYTQDFDETLPMASYAASAAKPYCGITSVNSPFIPKWMDMLYPYIKNRGVFTCPDYPQKATGGPLKNYNTYVPQPLDSCTGGRPATNLGTYSQNGAYYGETLAPASGPAGQPIPRVAAPADTIFVLEMGEPSGTLSATVSWINDTVNPVVKPRGFVPPTTPNVPFAAPGLWVTGGTLAQKAQVYLYHFEGMNLLFCDGHAKWMKGDQIVQTHTVKGRPIEYRFTIQDD